MIKLAANGSLSGQQKEALRVKMDEQCREASALERIAEDAERKVDALWKAFYMGSFIGTTFDGIVNGVTDFALFVSLDNTAEGMLHVSRLDGYFEYQEDAMALVCRGNGMRYRLGDPVRVRLESVDTGAGHINFNLPDPEA